MPVYGLYCVTWLCSCRTYSWLGLLGWQCGVFCWSIVCWPQLGPLSWWQSSFLWCQRFHIVLVKHCLGISLLHLLCLCYSHWWSSGALVWLICCWLDCSDSSGQASCNCDAFWSTSGLLVLDMGSVCRCNYYGICLGNLCLWCHHDFFVWWG